MDEENNYRPEDREEQKESARSSYDGAASSVEYGPSDYYRSNTGAPKGSSGRFMALVIALCILFSLLAGVGGILIGKNLVDKDGAATKPPEGNSSGTSTSGSTVLMKETDANAATLDGTLTAVVSKSADSVVEIRTESYTGSIFGETQSGAGSGVIIGEDETGTYSYIVTNNHVIEGNISSVIVRTTAGEEYEAEPVGTDWMSDIAVLRIKKAGLTVATWASSEALLQGQEVVVIGNPLGALGGSVTSGIISGLERTITIEGIPMTLLQVDAAVNPGNSGGGLFDMNGNLIGIVNAKSVGSNIDNIGFAIPANYAKDMVRQICEKGYVSGRVDLGFTFASSITNTGLTVYSYAYNDEISTAISQGDILYSLEVGGSEVVLDSLSDYRGVLASLKAGDSVKAVLAKSQSFGFHYTTYTVTLIAHESIPAS